MRRDGKTRHNWGDKLRLFVDGYAGLGGASEYFMGLDQWEVLRFDNNPKLSNVPAMILCDLLEHEIECTAVEVAWFSPPCLDFSQAYDAPRPRAQRNGEEFEPDLSLVKRAIEIIEELNPKWWIIENVVGAIADFKPLLGPPRQIIGPFVLCGNFPLIIMPNDFRHVKAEVDERRSDIRSNIRAKIPLEISKGLFEAIDNQRTILDYVGASQNA